jgi:hypothetical protein
LLQFVIVEVCRMGRESTTMRFNALNCGLLSLALLISTSATQAEVLNPKLDAKHSFKVGIFFQNADFDVAVTRPPDTPTTLDLADDLGVDVDVNSPLIEYRWRFLERWHLSFGYHAFDSDGFVGNLREFNFNGTVYPVGYEIKTDIGFDAYILDVNYALFTGDRHEFSIGAGLHAFDLNLEIGGRLFVGETEADRVNEKSELFAPLPNVRFYGFYALSPKWHVSATAGWLSLEYDNWTGDYRYLGVRTEYQISKRFGVGVGYQAANVDLKRDTTAKLDEYNFDLTGPTIYFSFAI